MAILSSTSSSPGQAQSGSPTYSWKWVQKPDQASWPGQEWQHFCLRNVPNPRPNKRYVTYGIFSILIRINFHTTSKGSEYVKAKLSKTTVTFLLIPTIITPVVLLCIEMQIAVYSHYSFPSSRQGSHHIKMVSGRRRSAPKMGYCMVFFIVMVLQEKTCTSGVCATWSID